MSPAGQAVEILLESQRLSRFARLGVNNHEFKLTSPDMEYNLSMLISQAHP